MAKVISAAEAAALIGDGMTVAVDGFIGFSLAEDILCEMEERFLREGHPRDLRLVNVAGSTAWVSPPSGRRWPPPGHQSFCAPGDALPAFVQQSQPGQCHLPPHQRRGFCAVYGSAGGHVPHDAGHRRQKAGGTDLRGAQDLCGPAAGWLPHEPKGLGKRRGSGAAGGAGRAGAALFPGVPAGCLHHQGQHCRCRWEHQHGKGGLSAGAVRDGRCRP